ncbi:hypothetical protein [Pseudacidovorax sp. RU35E]|uniref:hypothetical protein n=1 Tax=Pseudacidovorax sp. RU35E TaxID=1907403 RepID=UPI000953A647|nr:hypothetical protein [Pseudacidovorax sp. RU35E]SIR06869.1 hypothetical protein SAMN05880557_107304 [Pseudacidovorax sp. RU35E]
MLMRPFAIVDAHGKLVMSGMSPQPPACPEACTLLGTEPPSPTSFWDFATQAWCEPSPRPSARHVFDWPSHSWIDPRTLAEIKADQQAAISAEGRRRAAALTAGYPDFEQKTWPTQEREALAWEVNPAAPTPFLDGIAAVRGIPATEMRAKTLAAVNAFRQASQYLVGTRQALRDAIEAATTAEAVQAITWPNDPTTTDAP